MVVSGVMVAVMSVPYGDQTYRERPPLPAVADHVSSVWLHRVSADSTPYEHRTVPNGSVEITHTIGADHVHVVGPQQRPLAEHLAPGTSVVGVRLRPGAAPAILGMPATELLDQQLVLDHGWDRSWGGLAERLADASAPRAAAAELQGVIGARLATGASTDPLVAETVRRLQPWRSHGVDAAVSDLYISSRQLRRRFVAALGYGPKTLHRILRFQGLLALGLAPGSDRLPLGRLAAMAGYADQAHLTRECLRLTGMTPTVFLEETRRSCIGRHDHAVSFANLRDALLRVPSHP